MSSPSVIVDPLAELAAEPVIIAEVPANTSEAVVQVAPVSRVQRLVRSCFSLVRFLAAYVLVSSLLFAVFMSAANFGAYSQVVHQFFFSDGFAASSQAFEQAIQNGRVSVASVANASGEEDITSNTATASANNNTSDAARMLSPERFASLGRVTSLSDIEVTPYDNRIIIPKIGKNIPLVDVDAYSHSFDPNKLEALFMKELEKGVVRYPGTSAPGEQGNSFIFGHSSNYPWIKGEYNDVFALLGNLSDGDQIIVFYHQKKYVYTVREKKVIHPGDVKALKRDDTKTELTLMTCWPIGTVFQRLLVFAELTPNESDPIAPKVADQTTPQATATGSEAHSS